MNIFRVEDASRSSFQAVSRTDLACQEVVLEGRSLKIPSIGLLGAKAASNSARGPSCR